MTRDEMERMFDEIRQVAARYNFDMREHVLRVGRDLPSWEDPINYKVKPLTEYTLDVQFTKFERF